MRSRHPASGKPAHQDIWKREFTAVGDLQRNVCKPSKAKSDAALKYWLESHPDYVHRTHPELFEYDRDQYMYVR